MEITRIRAGDLADPEVDELLAEIVEFDRAINRALGFGSDFDPLPGSVRGKLVRSDAFTSHEIWLGRIEGRLVAKSGAYLSLSDNTDVADVYTGVLPEARRHGLGTQLLTVMETQLREDGRTRMNAWCEMPALDFSADPRRPRIAAAAGTGSLPADHGEVAFALHSGYRLQQIERCSAARIQGAAIEGEAGVPVPEMSSATGDETTSEAPDGTAAGDDYTIRTWAGPTPVEHVEAIALLRQKMSTDVPGAAELYDESKWDGDRVRALEADREFAGGRTQTALALLDGEGVGFTEVVSYAGRPNVAYQGATLVRSEHRGHGLGARLKIANHAALRRDSPIERVYTWNAAENSWMLAINDRAGFAAVGWVGLWKKILD
ncbi:GNAT family N-acetyltransferase [Brevibacterium oceani]|uniref:GNAT family N-acetyltransferase n=1 Tax=Brevibacterium oceani TaxID=358099 RepID=UPI0015E716B9|nr:GNAT family N-acetyltransferase [Brevibacterium oceani]